jgi:hypothetical protein
MIGIATDPTIKRMGQPLVSRKLPNHLTRKNVSQLMKRILPLILKAWRIASRAAH